MVIIPSGVYKRIVKLIPEVKLCQCGCGNYAKPGKRFIWGHNVRVKNPLKNKKHSENAKEKMRKPKSEKAKKNMSKSHLGKGKGKDNSNWKGGISFIYHSNFNVVFCRKIRKLYGNICQICDKTNKQNINETTKILD